MGQSTERMQELHVSNGIVARIVHKGKPLFLLSLLPINAILLRSMIYC
jgi:hypothetical protein